MEAIENIRNMREDAFDICNLSREKRNLNQYD